MYSESYYLNWGNLGAVGRIDYEVNDNGQTFAYTPLTESKLSYPTGMYPVSMIGRSIVPDRGYIPTSPDILKWFKSRVIADNNQMLTSVLSNLGLNRYDVWELTKHTSGKSVDDKWWIEPVNMRVGKYRSPGFYNSEIYRRVLSRGKGIRRYSLHSISSLDSKLSDTKSKDAIIVSTVGDRPRRVSVSDYIRVNGSGNKFKVREHKRIPTDIKKSDNF